MGRRYHLTGWALVAAQGLVGWMANRHYRHLPLLEAEQDAGTDHGHVTIVVPARNEARRLPALLHSLSALRYPRYDVVVVDDASTDGTADLARACGARVVSVSDPPAGWTGKSYACQQGAATSTAEWLLFTDADTVHGPDSLGLALRLAVSRGAGLVSLLARQRCETFGERLLLPYSYALYFAGAHRINQPGGPAIANGQYLLFRRDAYWRLGGHAAVRRSLIEDVSLARQASRRGLTVLLARAEQHLEVRMYQDLASLWEGLGKNVFRFVSVSPRTGLPTIVATLILALALPAAVRGQSRLLRLSLLMTPALGLAPWVRRFGAPGYFALLHPLAALAFQVLALDSMRRTVTGSATWKGRRY